MGVLSELKNRGVTDVFFVVCDGLKGLPDSVEAVDIWPPNDCSVESFDDQNCELGYQAEVLSTFYQPMFPGIVPRVVPHPP